MTFFLPQNTPKSMSALGELTALTQTTHIAGFKRAASRQKRNGGKDYG